MNNIEILKNESLAVESLKNDFPILQQKINDKRLVYLDNAATTQKPLAVINALQHYYLQDNANIHRGVHALSVRATQAYEAAREELKQFINANSLQEIIFVKGATEAINLVAQSYGQKISAGDDIIISTLEHHSNIVPWQILCEKTNANLQVIPIDEEGNLDLDEFKRLLSNRTKLVAVSHMSNAIGIINPIAEIIALAHEVNAVVLVDGAQAAPHLHIDVQKLDCDFYAFSAHKLYGPTGIGVLYGKASLLEEMPPYQGGGDMISSVTFAKTTYHKLPHKFEAGTPNIAGVIGFAEAIRYLKNIGLERIRNHEHLLLQYMQDALSSVPGLRIIGDATKRAAVASFVLDNIHPHDVGTILDHEGIAIRAGHHCAMPLMARLNLVATARASLALYNTYEDIDALVEAIDKAKRLFA